MRKFITTTIVPTAGDGFAIWSDMFFRIAPGTVQHMGQLIVPKPFRTRAAAAFEARVMRRYFQAHGKFPCLTDPLHEWAKGPVWQRRKDAA